MTKGYLGSLTNEVDLEVIEEAYTGDYLSAPWIPVLMDEVRRLRIERNQLREIVRGILVEGTELVGGGVTLSRLQVMGMRALLRIDRYDSDEVIHMCPPGEGGTMPCCGRTPFEVSRFDRIALVEDDVTCGKEGG